MIQANELRIWNWVNYHDDDIIFQVTEISKLGIGVKNDTEETWIEYDRFSPIKLTPKILEKCGFKVDGTYNNAKRWISESPIILFEGNGYFKLCHYSITQIKHLHQLQNLYYSLVGVELEVVW